MIPEPEAEVVSADVHLEGVLVVAELGHQAYSNLEIPGIRHIFTKKKVYPGNQAYPDLARCRVRHIKTKHISLLYVHTFKKGKRGGLYFAEKIGFKNWCKLGHFFLSLLFIELSEPMGYRCIVSISFRYVSISITNLFSQSLIRKLTYSLTMSRKMWPSHTSSIYREMSSGTSFSHLFIPY